VNELLKQDGREVQLILPNFVLAHTPIFAQVMFFGALLSAILSTASGALIAPTALATENIVRPFLRNMSDRQFLLLLRTVLVVFTLAALLFALNSRSTMYEMVQNAYKVTLVSCIVPLAAGIFWRRANTVGATLSVVFGLGTWVTAEFVAPEATVPPQLVGLAASLFGMVLGSYAARAKAAHPPAHPAAHPPAHPPAHSRHG
jgi:Na+/proline symporter